MKYFKAIWARIFISLLSGGIIAELIHISTGDPNRPMPESWPLLLALIIFVILTLIVKKADKKSL